MWWFGCREKVCLNQKQSFSVPPLGVEPCKCCYDGFISGSWTKNHLTPGWDISKKHSKSSTSCDADVLWLWTKTKTRLFLSVFTIFSLWYLSFYEKLENFVPVVSVPRDCRTPRADLRHIRTQLFWVYFTISSSILTPYSFIDLVVFYFKYSLNTFFYILILMFH